MFAECFRVLMPGRKLCLVTANVNQHTEHGLLTFPLAADFLNLLRDVGFVVVNEIIWSKDGTRLLVPALQPATPNADGWVRPVVVSADGYQGRRPVAHR